MIGVRRALGDSEILQFIANHLQTGDYVGRLGSIFFSFMEPGIIICINKILKRFVGQVNRALMLEVPARHSFQIGILVSRWCMLTQYMRSTTFLLIP